MRLDILRAVWESPAEGVSFSEIRERVGSPNSGQFNYHLGKLRGHFLRETGDGYELTQAGLEVVRAVLAGTMTERPRVDPEPIDGDCATCGGRLTVRYDEHAVVECADCGRVAMWNEFPPAGLDDRTAGELATAFDRWTRHRFRLAMDGVCPSCAGKTATSLVEGGERVEEAEDDGDAEVTGDGVATVHRCGTCKYEARVPLLGHVARHPAVVSLFYDAGVDVTDLPYWELQALADGYETAVLSEEPWAARVTIETADRRLRLTLDEHLDVTEVEASAST
jgi:hypothetical protein